MSRSRSAGRILLSALVAALAVGCGEAMSEEDEGLPLAGEEQPGSPPPAVEAGTTVVLSLQGSLSTEDEIQGQPFQAVVTESVSGSDGSIMIPVGSAVIGVVAAARKSDGPDQPAVLQLQPESLVIDGRTYPLSATVVEAAVRADTRDANSETAAKVGVGAVAGALAGKLIGGENSDALKGAAVGAAAGGVVAHVTRPGHAEMDEGARIVIRLEERLVVR